MPWTITSLTLAQIVPGKGVGAKWGWYPRNAGVAPGKREMERSAELAAAEDPHGDWRRATVRHFYRTRPRSRAQTTSED